MLFAFDRFSDRLMFKPCRQGNNRRFSKGLGLLLEAWTTALVCGAIHGIVPEAGCAGQGVSRWRTARMHSRTLNQVTQSYSRARWAADRG